MEKPALLLGVDGGGTKCRARLCTKAGEVLGEGTGGPANIRLGIEESFAEIFAATRQCLKTAGLSWNACGHSVACLALAGASEPAERLRAERHTHPFRRMIVTTDAHAACVGAHGGADGGVIVIGTGSIGWAVIGGKHYRCGGWGFPISDEGSGAWLGCEAIKRVMRAHDRSIPWSPLLREVFAEFRCDSHAVVRWLTQAKPRDFARFAPAVVEHVADDPAATEIMRGAAAHIDSLAACLLAWGAPRLALAGGLAEAMEAFLSPAMRAHLVPPKGDAVDGAVHLAREDLDALVAAD
jgi:glucosamine kinase